MKKKITNFQIGTLNYFITRTFLVGVTLNAIINVMHADSWIIPLLSIIPGIIFILLVNYIMDYEPDLTLSEKLVKLFKNKIGYLIIILFSIFVYFMCTLNYLNLTSFIRSQFLTKTPLLAICIMFVLASLYIIIKGIHTVSRTSNILFYSNIVLLTISILGLLQVIDISNLKPLFTFNMMDLTKGLNVYYAFNITPIILLTIIPKNEIIEPKLKKSLIISYILACITLFITVFLTISVLGYELSSLYEYAEFNVLKQVSIFGLNSRIESILVMQLLFDIFIGNVLMTYFISDNIKTVAKCKNPTIIYIIVSIIIVIGALFLSRYNIYLDNFMVNIIPIAATIFITFMIAIICIKIKKDKKSTN